MAIIGCFHDGESQQGSVYAFRYAGEPGEEVWGQEQKITAASSGAFDHFGHDVAVLGDVAVVGAPGEDNKGEVYTFRYFSNLQEWIQEAQTLDPGSPADQFGYAVAMDNDGSDDVLVIGAPWATHDSDHPGAAYVYRHNGLVWVFKQKLLPSDPDHDMWFGCSVDIEDGFIIVGAKYADVPDYNQSGAAYVFKLSEGTWVEEAKLLASDPGTNHNFGVSVAVTFDDREKFVVGASGHDGGKGALYYFDPLAFDCNDNGEYDACECIEDLDPNGEIDIDDLFKVLAAWGPCDGCCADFNHDDVVDIDDLFHILASWGPCPDKGSGTPPQSIYDCWEYINDPQKFQTCIEAMTIIGAGGGQ